MYGFSLVTAVAGTFAMFAAEAQTQTGFCGRYIQTWSNAGQCADCRLRIAADPEARSYSVESSNGWNAELTFMNGHSSLAGGAGNWKSGLGHSYSGRNFEILLAQQHRELAMVMITEINGRRQVVRAKFRCLDSERDGSL